MKLNYRRQPNNNFRQWQINFMNALRSVGMRVRLSRWFRNLSYFRRIKFQDNFNISEKPNQRILCWSGLFWSNRKNFWSKGIKLNYFRRSLPKLKKSSSNRRKLTSILLTDSKMKKKSWICLILIGILMFTEIWL